MAMGQLAAFSVDCLKTQPSYNGKLEIVSILHSYTLEPANDRLQIVDQEADPQSSFCPFKSRQGNNKHS
jgi:hypothetical protein